MMTAAPASKWKRWHKWTLGTIIGLSVLIVVAGLSGPPPADSDSGASKTATAATPTPTPQTPLQRLTAALKKEGGNQWKLRNVQPASKTLGHPVFVVADTPEGGFDGASVADLDRAFASAMQAAHSAGWKQKLEVEFRGGAENRATGKDEPNFVMGRFEITGAQFQDITDWSDDNVQYGGIDWSYYRTYASDLLKQ